MINSKSTHKTILALTATILAAGGAQAYELKLGTNMPPVDFHGFASQGFLDSTGYNYLANNTERGSFKFSEAAINASMNPFPRRDSCSMSAMSVNTIRHSTTRRLIILFAMSLAFAPAAFGARKASTTPSRTSISPALPYCCRKACMTPAGVISADPSMAAHCSATSTCIKPAVFPMKFMAA
jgi:hypothetical protein